MLRSSILLGLLAPLTVKAAEPAARSTDVLTAEAVLQMVLGLGLVVGVILLLAWGLRRLSNLHPSGKMKVVATLPLGTRERAMLIEVGDRQVLLGVAPGRVSLLADYPEKVIETDSAFARELKSANKPEAPL